MAKKGSLSKNKFFPGTGDILEDHSEGISWECAKANAYFDERTNTKIRYALLVGRHPDFEAPLVKAIHDTDGSSWLEDISVIQRKKAGGLVPYTLNPATGTWQT